MFQVVFDWKEFLFILILCVEASSVLLEVFLLGDVQLDEVFSFFLLVRVEVVSDSFHAALAKFV